MAVHFHLHRRQYPAECERQQHCRPVHLGASRLVHHGCIHVCAYSGMIHWDLCENVLMATQSTYMQLLTVLYPSALKARYLCKPRASPHQRSRPRRTRMMQRNLYNLSLTTATALRLLAFTADALDPDAALRAARRLVRAAAHVRERAAAEGRIRRARRGRRALAAKRGVKCCR